MDYRRLPLKGLCNARDLGGYPAQGGITKFHEFIRSEAPDKVTDKDIEFLKGYGVTVAIEFRGEQEIARQPNKLSDVQGIEFNLSQTFDSQVAFASNASGKEEAGQAGEQSNAGQGEQAGEQSNAGQGEKEKDGKGGKDGKDGKDEKRPAMDAFVDWGEKYIEISQNCGAWVRNTLELMAGAKGAVIYNCATGKDRTGIISALLLGIAGVSERDIIADYSVSEIYLKEAYVELLKGYLAKWPDDKATIESPFFKTSPKNMETLLAHFDSAHGGVAGYVKSCGVSDDTVAALRRKLVEPIPKI
ncbi:MAG: tyrosine-protein phosphatase [Oscillospiraceae bacterium]|nr:tyrosine-protein phosphatase [Oscillospiraceae bacterium]